MAKFASNDMLDGSLLVLKNNVTRMVACSAQPTTYTEANATYALADVTMSGTDFTIADGDVDGRKVTVAAKSGVEIDASGDATHVALLDVTGERLLYVTTCNTLTLTSGAGNTVNFPAWTITIADPT